MTYEPLHRKPRWHDRPRAWLRAVLDWACGREEEHVVWHGRDDHGNPISDLFTAEVRKCPECGTWYHGTGCHFCGYGYQDDDDIPERPVLRTAKVSGVHLPLSGDPDPWAPCAFRHDVARPDERPPGSEVAGPGYRQLTMWDLVPVPAPWKPRTWPPILSGPRVCGGRIALLAGGW